MELYTTLDNHEQASSHPMPGTVTFAKQADTSENTALTTKVGDFHQYEQCYPDSYTHQGVIKCKMSKQDICEVNSGVFSHEYGAEKDNGKEHSFIIGSSLRPSVVKLKEDRLDTTKKGTEQHHAVTETTSTSEQRVKFSICHILNMKDSNRKKSPFYYRKREDSDSPG